MKKQESNFGLILIVSFLITWCIVTTLFLISLVSETVVLWITGFITAIGVITMSLVIADVIINKFKKRIP